VSRPGVAGNGAPAMGNGTSRHPRQRVDQGASPRTEGVRGSVGDRRNTLHCKHFLASVLVAPRGFEPPTQGSGIRMSVRREVFASNGFRLSHRLSVPRLAQYVPNGPVSREKPLRAVSGSGRTTWAAAQPVRDRAH
jgi:hypothetical protein